MKLIVTVELDRYLGYVHYKGFLYQNQAILFEPELAFADWCDYFYPTTDYGNKGYGEAIRKAKPVNIKHDTVLRKMRRFICNL